MALSYIVHKNKQVLFIEYYDCKKVDDYLLLLDEIKDEFLKTKGVWLTLHDFSNGFGNNEFMKKANQYAKEYFNTRPAKNAAIGVTGLKRILMQGYNLIVKDKIVPFDTKEEALDYLVS
jgi:hypothetical protein